MSATRTLFGILLLGTFVLSSQQAQGQWLQTGGNLVPSKVPTTPALRYFGRSKHLAVQRYRKPRAAAVTRPFRNIGGKPFQNVQSRPTISPYLSLDALESGAGVPNYYTRVLPLIQQQQASQTQAAKLRRLQQQVRQANRPGPLTNTRNGGVPTTGHSSQFLNQGSYFPSLPQ